MTEIKENGKSKLQFDFRLAANVHSLMPILASSHHAIEIFQRTHFRILLPCVIGLCRGARRGIPSAGNTSRA